MTNTDTIEVIEVKPYDPVAIEVQADGDPVVIAVPGGGGGGPGGGGGVPVVFTQAIPAAVWGPINHNFGYRPVAVAIFSLDYTQQYEEFNVQHFDENTLRIGMETPSTGRCLVGR